ncbi:MAG: lipopolysaccharide biosynthesis protein [Olsenella sp.]
MARDLKTTTVRSLFWKLFEQGGSAAIQLVVQIVMARLLAPAEFGMLAIMTVFVNIGNVIVQSGLNTAIIQSPDLDDDDCSTVFWMSLTISCVLYLVIYLAAPAVAGFYSMPAIVWPLRALVLILIVNAYNAIQEALVARHMDFKKTFRATVAAAVVSGVSAISAALAGAGIWALVVQQLAFQLTKCVVLMAEVPWKPRLVFVADRARTMFRFGWKLLVSGLIDQGYTSLSSLVIGHQFTSADLGYVTQGERYPQALGVVLDGAIQPVMLSAVSRVQDDKDRVKRLASRGLKTSTFLIVPAMGAFALVARPLVVLLLGEKWLPAVPFLQMYCLIYAFLPIHTTNLQVLNGMGRSDAFLRLEVIKKGVGVAMLCVTAFAIHDLYAIVIGYIINNVISTFINAEPNRKVIGYSYLEQVRDICPAFALTSSASAVAWPLSLLDLPSLALIVLQVLAMGAAYLLLARLLRVEELSYLVTNVRSYLARRRESDRTGA